MGFQERKCVMSELRVKVLDSCGRLISASVPCDDICLVHGQPYDEGDIISIESSKDSSYIWIQLDESMMPALAYLPKKQLFFKIPSTKTRTGYSPKSFYGDIHLIRARFASEEDLKKRKNLALNPYDFENNPFFYPHVTASVQTPDEPVFAARNVIDGIRENCYHYGWPYLSWGINKDPDASIKVDFGRDVEVDEIALTLRADFPHDSWWKSAVIDFSDGSSMQIHPSRTEKVQTFALDESKIIRWLTLGQLEKGDDSPFPALTQIEVFGKDLL